MSERKYGQKGYQSDAPREQRGGPAKPPERREGPRGRGLGAPTEETFRCATCGAKQAAPAPDAYDASCFKCRTALHSCSHCSFFDTSAPKECRKPILERVAKKTGANRCELFEPKVALERNEGHASGSDVRAAFDALFKL
jgi:hypothetical protein